jgi:hypothetical protein
VKGRYPLVSYGNRGIYGSMNNNSYISCNLTDSTKIGIYFGGNNLGTKFRGNEMKKHNIGLYLNNTAVIDTQSHAGNMWTGVYNSSYGAWNENDSSTFNLKKSLFISDLSLGAIYNPAIPLGGSGFPNDLGWFEPGSGNTYSCDGLYLCIDEHEARGEGSGDLKEAIALDSTITSDFIPESKMIAQMDLFEELKEDSLLKSSNIVFENFVSDKENQSIGYLYKTKAKQKELDSYSSQQSAALQTADSLISVYLNEIKILDSIAVADSSINNMQARENLMNSLYAEMSAKENVTNQIQSANISKINEAKSFNSLVVSNSLPDENMKQMNEINFLYLLYGKDTLNAYYSIIQNIGEQCPFSGGKAVYIARGFAEMLNDAIVFDDDICLQQGYYRLALADSNKIDNKPDIFLIPNPADEITKIILNKKYDGVCKVSITDSYSKNVYKHEFDCKQQQLSISTKRFSQGVYYVRITINNTTRNLKLIIAR